MKKIFYLFIILFIATASVGFLYWQKNDYSKEILKFEILSNEEARAGDLVEYTVKLKNNGKFRLENPELTFQFPDQSIAENSEEARSRQKIADIYPGEERTYSFKARLFGEKGQVLTAKAWLDYKPKGLKAVYESKTSFATRIKSVPISFEFDLPPKIERGSGLDFSLNYFSSLDYPLANLMVKVNYPGGFSFQSATPSSIDNKQWILPTLTQASGGRIEIKGMINGKEGEGKTFSAELGMIKGDQFWPLKKTSQTIVISEPSIYLSVLVNGSENYFASAGEVLHYEIFFKNIGNKLIQKKFLIAKLDGALFDLDSIRSEKGEFGKGDNTIIWDWKNTPSLRFLSAGQEGEVEFWVKVKDNPPNNFIANPRLGLTASISGIEKKYWLKVNSKVDFSQEVFRQEEFFGNSGPIPPVVGESSQYVIVWRVGKNWNNLKEAKIKMILPKNVSPSGLIFPEDAKFTYDPESREVIWKIGDMPAKAGEDKSEKVFAFQVNFIPDESQKGSVQPIANEAEFSAEDEWTNQIIEESAPGQKTDLPSDQTISYEQGIVN